MNTGNNPLSGLNEVQLEAVNHREGALLLLAGAGSGKTRVVTCRIAQLLQEGVMPEQILALTFTNKAAREMRERVSALLGLDEEPPLNISTFHALGAKMLRRHAEHFGRTRNFTIYDTDDQISVMRESLSEQGFEFKKAEIRVVLRAVDRAKNAGHPASNMVLPSEFVRIDAARLGESYETRLKRSDAFDFGDLITRPAILLRESPRICARYQALWKWVLVDEFQDTNAAQYQWLSLMAPPGSNLFAVGDDDQSIYGWRGADVGNILKFPEEYPDCRVVRLEQNYRSHRYILDAANGVIAHNQKRLGKSLWTEREGGARLEVYEASDGRTEAHWIAGRIQALCAEDGYRAGDVAVLMRANHLSLDLENALRLIGMPYTVVRGRAFFERAEIKDALSYARLLVNPNDEAAFRRAIAAPSRGVGKVSLERIEQAATRDGESLWHVAPNLVNVGGLKGKARKGLRDFIDIITAYQGAVDSSLEEDGLLPSDQLRNLLSEAGLLRTLHDTDHRDETIRQKQENIHRLLSEVEAWESNAPDPSLGAYLEQVKLISDIDRANLAEGGSISLMTVHASKGLEFPIVVVLAMEESIFPHANSIRDGDVEEERRLCYVALTRAQERLLLTRARVRRTFNEPRANAPSRFLNELPVGVIDPRYERPPRRRTPRHGESRVQFEASKSTEQHFMSPTDFSADEYQSESGQYRPGMKVWHAQFGLGQVTEIHRGSRLTLSVSFEDIGTLKIVSDYVSPYEG